MQPKINQKMDTFKIAPNLGLFRHNPTCFLWGERNRTESNGIERNGKGSVTEKAAFSSQSAKICNFEPYMCVSFTKLAKMVRKLSTLTFGNVHATLRSGPLRWRSARRKLLRGNSSARPLCNQSGLGSFTLVHHESVTMRAWMGPHTQFRGGVGLCVMEDQGRANGKGMWQLLGLVEGDRVEEGVNGGLQKTCVCTWNPPGTPGRLLCQSCGQFL